VNVRRLVSNIAAAGIAAAKRFYGDMQGLEVIMDHGWITTFGSRQQMIVQGQRRQ
jgi:hypothetical protein